jgi:hypothetical protein
MSKWLTDDDRKRIKDFAELPAYMRSPEMLVPSDESEE